MSASQLYWIDVLFILVVFSFPLCQMSLSIWAAMNKKTKTKTKTHKLGGFINSRHLFHPALEAGSPRLWHPHGPILEKALWVADWPLLYCPPTMKGRGYRGLCAVSFRRIRISFMGLCPRDLKAPPPNTITFVGFNIWITGGHNHLDQITKNTWGRS